MATHIYQLVPSYNTGGQFAQSVFHYSFDDAGFSTSKGAASALINAFDAAKRTALRAFLPTDVSIISYRARAIGTVGGFNAFLPITSTNAGTRSGVQSATGLNPCIIHFPLNPAHGRGKWFLPGVSETDIEDGRYTDTYSSAINTLLGTFFDPLTLTGGGGPTAIFGWPTTGLPVAFRVPSMSILSQNLATQRRRMKPA
jgi:hypothetical protein